jgi:cyclopropane-fatty-acyl-phospholipid synthase
MTNNFLPLVEPSTASHPANARCHSVQAVQASAVGEQARHGTRPASARIMQKLLGHLRHGSLQVRWPDGSVQSFGENTPDGTSITLELFNWQLCNSALRSGDIGLAESYIAHDWHTDNLPGLIELLARNRSAIEAMVYGTWWGSLLYRVKHWLNRNSKSGSRKNIHAHYDIGNHFYGLWLDRSMTYSSALGVDECGGDLEQAQLAKYRRILAQLRVAPGERVLEIGCGWGGFAELAAREAKTHVTGLTLSTEQLRYAQQRLHDAGLTHATDLKICDYRDSVGQYDAIASIEMFEAVGQAYWDSYFAALSANLKPGGRACIQSIVIADELFERYCKGTDFIQQYIFPGGMLPCPAVFRQYAQKHGFTVVDEFCFGLDYAKTLEIWLHQFHQRLPQVHAQGFDQNFVRTWEFYLAYCIAAFRADNTDVMHFTLQKSPT